MSLFPLTNSECKRIVCLALAVAAKKQASPDTQLMLAKRYVQFVEGDK